MSSPFKDTFSIQSYRTILAIKTQRWRHARSDIKEQYVRSPSVPQPQSSDGERNDGYLEIKIFFVARAS